MSDKTVKSVRRVFEILELFDRERKPLAAKYVAKTLNYPLTSTHALLKSMHELGYADFDGATWSYIPSPVFSNLLDWVRDFLVKETRILELTTALNRATRETINISRRANTSVRIIHGLESVHSVGVSVKVGTMMPVTASLTGIVALACLKPDDLRTELDRLQSAESREPVEVNVDLIHDIHDELRRVGSVLRCDVFIAGIGALCVPVLTQERGELLVIGVVGPSDRILEQASENRKTLHRLIRQHKVKTLFPLRNASG